VRTDARKAGFIGDMPHAWVASDFVRSMLDAFAYETDDGSLIVGAGLAPKWLAKPIHVGPLLTSTGTIDIRVRNGVMELRGTARPQRLVVAGREVRVPPAGLKRPLRFRIE
jgi:hypothetical protein